MYIYTTLHAWIDILFCFDDEYDCLSDEMKKSEVQA